MPGTNTTAPNLRETLIGACVEGPAALRRLVREQGLRLATEFNGIRTTSLLEMVLRAVVLRGAPMRVLDVLEEQWPGLEVNDGLRNGLTELVAMEHNIHQGFCRESSDADRKAKLEPNPRLRASIHAAVRNVLTRTPFDPDRLYQHRPNGSCDTKLPRLALYNQAYYVFESLPDPSLDQLADDVLFTRQNIWSVRSHITPIAQDALVHLVPSAPSEQLRRIRTRLLEGYNEVWERGTTIHWIEESYERLNIIRINVHLMESELRARQRLRLFLRMYRPVFHPRTRTRRFRLEYDFPRDVFELVADMACEF